MRARNWREYNKNLVQRGSLSFLIDPKIAKTFTPKPRKKKRKTCAVLRSTHSYSSHDQNSLKNALSNA